MIFSSLSSQQDSTERPVTKPDDGRSISQNGAHLNILFHVVISLLYYEYWTDEQKYFYVYQNAL